MSNLSQFGKNVSYPAVVDKTTIPIDIIICGGGGGAGIYDTLSQFRRAGGGGGGGQVVELNNFLVNRGDSYSCIVGQGGARGTNTQKPSNGGDSSFIISSASRGNLPQGFGIIKAIGGGGGGSYVNPIGLVAASPGGCGGGAGSGLKSNNSTFYRHIDIELRPGVASIPGTYSSSIVNEEGSITTYTVSGYGGSNGDPRYNTTVQRFCGGGGGGAGGEGTAGRIQSTTIMAGNGGPGYRSAVIPNINGSPRVYGPGGAGSFTFRNPPGASVNSSNGIRLDFGGSDIQFGGGGNSNTPTLAQNGIQGQIVVSYPTAYGPSTTSGFSVETTSRPGYYIYYTNGASGTITFPT